MNCLNVATSLRPLHGYGDRPVNLVCFPHAGAGAWAYCAWSAPLRDVANITGVQLAGREDRCGEPFATCCAMLVRELADAVADLPPSPQVLFGHSLGASLAHAVAAELQARGNAVSALVVSGQVPTGSPQTRLSTQGDETLAQRVRALGGMPHALLDDPNFAEMWWPLLWADMRLADDCFAAGRQPILDTALHVLCGRDDPLVPVADVMRWRTASSRPVQVHAFDGGHFFLFEQAKFVINYLRGVLLNAAT